MFESWDEKQTRERLERWGDLSLGELIKAAAAAAVEDHEYRHSDQHIGHLDDICTMIDEKYNTLMERVEALEKHSHEPVNIVEAVSDALRDGTLTIPGEAVR